MIQTPSKEYRYLPTGQSLIEILVGVTVTGLIILASGNLLQVVNRSSSYNRQVQRANFLLQELTENVAVYADAKWYCVPTSAGDPTCLSDGAKRGLYNLKKGAAENYYLDTTSQPFPWVSGQESIDGYQRWFYVENVCRNQADGAVSGVEPVSGCPSDTSEDASTQKITVSITWNGGGAAQLQSERYLTRTRNSATGQTNWVGGDGQVIFSDPAKYDSAVNVDDSVRGSIKIQGY